MFRHALVRPSQLKRLYVLTCSSPTRAAQLRAELPRFAAAAMLCAISPFACAQSPSAQVMGPTQITPLPLSGSTLPANAVSVTQQTAPSTQPGSSNVLNSTISVQAPYAGSVPDGHASVQGGPLTLEQALRMGLKTNLAAIDQAAAVQQAEGLRTTARSALLPTLNVGVSEVFERENLRTLGVSLPSIPEASKFNYIDARVRLQQTVLDFVKIDSLHTASENLRASLLATRNTRDLIVLAVAGSYLQLTSTSARVQAARAQVEASRAIYKQAADRFEAGLVARVDRDRAQVQFQTEQQRLRSLEADLESQRLRFARLIGLPLSSAFTVAEPFQYSPLTDLTEATALQRAQAQRTDLQAAAAGVKAAETNLRGAHAERLPSLAVNADFGGAGTTPSKNSTSVYTVSGTLLIPLYEGGRIRGEVQQAQATLKQRQAELANVQAQAEQDVRQAFINLQAAADQVVVAQSNRDLSHETLTQSRDRFVAGVADSVEVVQSEQTVVQADDDLISAIFEHNLAKVALARAMGNAEQNLPQLLRK